MNENARALIDRLSRCGFTESSAMDLCEQYSRGNQREALEDYLRENETLGGGNPFHSER